MSLTSLAMFVYKVLLKPPPLRWLANRILLMIIPKRIQLPEGVVNLHPNDPVISGALAFGVYERYQLDVFRSMIQKDMTILDIGANIGLYTVIAAKCTGERGKVVSFEPEQENFSILTQNISDNDFKNVKPVRAAVADKEGSLVLYISEGNKGNHSIYKISDTEGEQQVPTVELDSWIENNNIGKVDLIKMDIQGAEPLAFKGMIKTFKTKPILFLEYDPGSIRTNGHEPLDMLKTLLSHGYELQNIDEASRSMKNINDIQKFTDSLGHTTYANLLCLSESYSRMSEI
jgi:FkbM family methyltransferase